MCCHVRFVLASLRRDGTASRRPTPPALPPPPCVPTAFKERRPTSLKEDAVCVACDLSLLRRHSTDDVRDGCRAMIMPCCPPLHLPAALRSLSISLSPSPSLVCIFCLRVSPPARLRQNSPLLPSYHPLRFIPLTFPHVCFLLHSRYCCYSCLLSRFSCTTPLANPLYPGAIRVPRSPFRF